ncbi:MAG: HlyD family efflux transporter periplasmic adaptor subunit [Cyanothece sp. SIO2G6]|nr:HlyD family efflux transporter periplasmic adaptor subunit [Cyanothece sp. SIO2G6]
MIKTQPQSRVVVWAGSAIALAIFVVGAFQYSQMRSTAKAEAEQAALQATLPSRTSVVALGRVEPQGEVIRVSGPTGDRLDRLEVEEGDRVSAGQILAYLESYDEREAERDYAAAQLAEAERNLVAETSFGEAQIDEAQARIQQADRPRSLEIEAQQATIRRLEAELALVQEDLERFDNLFREGAIAEQQFDEQQTATRRIEEDLNNAKATLVQLEESRTTDMAVAQQQLQSAQASLTRSQVQVTIDSARRNLELAEARLERTLIRAPRDGRVLRVLTYAGEAIANDGILDLGNTSQMVIVAEVYETDVSLVELGQPATVVSRNGAFEQTLTGTVTDIGWQIFKNDVLDDDPAANADARIVEVEVQLDADASAVVEALTNLQVDVRIDLEG